MIKAYIVEDELFAREDLKDLLHQFRNIQVVGETDEPQSAILEIHQLQPEVVFLDIHLSHGNGLDIAEQLCSVKNPPFIIFVTAYGEFAVRAFELDAVDYLLKPFDEKRLHQTIEKLVKWHQLKVQDHQLDTSFSVPIKNVNKLSVVQDDKIKLVDIHTIIYIGTENRQLIINTIDNRYKIDIPLYEFKQKLQSHTFLQVHRGYIVNLDFVNEIEQWFNGTYNLILKDGSKIPISRSYIKSVRQALDF